MNKLKTIFKWTLFNGLWVALAWAGYEQGMKWCENLFMFYTAFMFVFSSIAFVMIAILKHAVNTRDVDTDAFHTALVKTWLVPYIFNAGLDVVMITYLASKGFFVLATVVVFTMLAQYICRVFIKELRDAAIQRMAEQRLAEVRNNGNTQGFGFTDDVVGTRIPNPDDTFVDDDSDLFRMGITATPPPPSDD